MLLFTCLVVCLLATVVFPLDHIAPVAMLAPPQARRSRQAGSDPGRAVNRDSNACRAREVERNVRQNDFLWRHRIRWLWGSLDMMIPCVSDLKVEQLFLIQ
jgi:hypothetical protein